MKKTYFSILTILLLSLSLYLTSTTSGLTLKGTEHQHGGGMTMECMTPIQNFTISTTGSTLEFDKTKLEVPKNTCVGIMFMNMQPVEHNFVLENEAKEEWVHIHVNDSSTVVVEGMMPGMGMAFIMTPDEDITLPFYCSVQAGTHKEAGMKGNFVIGEGSAEDDAPSFGVLITVTSLSIIAVFSSIKRKSKF